MKTTLKKALMVLFVTGLITQQTPAKAGSWSDGAMALTVCVAAFTALGIFEAGVGLTIDALHNKWKNNQSAQMRAAQIREIYTKEIRTIADAAKNGTNVDTSRFEYLNNVEVKNLLLRGVPFSLDCLNFNLLHCLYNKSLTTKLSATDLIRIEERVAECNELLATFTHSALTQEQFAMITKEIAEQREEAPLVPNTQTPKKWFRELVPGVITFALENDTYKIGITGSVTSTISGNKKTYACGQDTTLTLTTTGNSFDLKAFSPMAKTHFALKGIRITSVTEAQRDGVTTIALKFERQ